MFGETPGDYHILLEDAVVTEILHLINGGQDGGEVALVHGFL